MTRTELPVGTTIQSNFIYTIDGVAGDGASCVVYNAHYTDRSEHHVLIKECYPYFSRIRREGCELVWEDSSERAQDIEKFYAAYDSLMSFQNKESTKNNTAPVFSTFEANGTCYTVTHLEGGKTFDKVSINSLADTLKVVQALAKAVKQLHNAGFLHLDIKPSNFLVLDGTRDMVRLFDFDTITPISELQSGSIKALSYSQGWAAPEQIRGDASKIGVATDIYGIGAVMFERIMGRKPDSTDRSMFADWELDGKLFDRLFPGATRIVKDIFKNTLAVNPCRRYQNADELIDALESAIKASRREQYIISYCPSCTADFIGREKELADIKTKFELGCNAVFLHGDGGVGKSELSKKYAELHSSEYDSVVFYSYNESIQNSLGQFAAQINFTNDEKESDRMKALKAICKETKALFIIDNFDVEFDEYAQDILGLDADFIITTRTMVGTLLGTSKSTVIELDTLSTQELVELFKNEYGRATTENEEKAIENIIESFDNWTLVVPIIAKSLIASGTAICDFSSQLEQDGFKSLDGSEEIILLKDGKALKKDPMSMLRYIFDFNTIAEEQKTVLRNVYCLRYHRHLTKEAYKKYTYSRNLNALNDLIFRNWVKYDYENDEITVHKVIEELIGTDLEITCETVPGIYKYIRSVVASLEKCERAEDAKELTFAMLLYSDMDESDDAARDIVLPVVEYMLRFFCDDKETVYRILCGAPDESGWHMYAQWYSSMLTDKLYDPSSDRMQSFLSMCNADPDIFDNNYDDIVQEYYLSILIYFCGLSVILYFVNMQGHNIHEGFFLSASVSSVSQDESVDESRDALLSFVDVANAILAKYQFVQFQHTNYSHQGLPIKKNKNSLELCQEKAESYLEMMQAIQVVLKNFQGDDYEQAVTEARDRFHIPSCMQYVTEEELYSMLQDCIINIEASVGRFVFYGMTKDELLSYEIPEYDDYCAAIEVYSKLRWSKKAKLWYASVDEALKKSDNPEPIYRVLLSWRIQTTVFSQSKIKELVNNGLIWRLISDERLSDTSKKDFLHIYIPNQVVELQKEKCHGWKATKKLARYSSTLLLYNQAIAFLEPLYSEKTDAKISNIEISIYRAIFIIKIATKLQAFDPKPRILASITPVNAEYICEFIELAKFTYWSGSRKLSQEMKNKILNLHDCIPAINTQEELHKYIATYLPFALKQKDDSAKTAFMQQLYATDHTIIMAELESPTLQKQNKMLLYNQIAEKYLAEIGQYYYCKVNNTEYEYPTVIEMLLKDILPIVNTFYVDFQTELEIMSIEAIVDHTLPPVETFDFVEHFRGTTKKECEALEGIFYYFISVADDEFLDNIPEGFFYDITEYGYPQERVEQFLGNLIKLRPEKESSIKARFALDSN